MLKKSTKSNNGNHSIASGVAGAAVVAAGVAAVVLSKKENRKKAGKFVQKVKSKGIELKKSANKKLSTIISENEKENSGVKFFDSKIASSSLAKN